MKKILFLLVVLISCSKDDEPSQPATPPCESILTSGITFTESYAYTNDQYSINGTKFCQDDIVALVFGTTEITTLTIQSNKLTFTVPVVSSTDSVALKIKTKTSTVDLKKKIAIFPGGGTWKEIQPFPGVARNIPKTSSFAGKGYLASGSKYTGYSNNTYNYEYPNDLYEYNPTSNAWTLIATHDNFKNKSDLLATTGKFYFFPITVSGGATVYQPSASSFSTTGSYAASSISNFSYTLGNDIYTCISENAASRITFRKYNSNTNQWDIQYAYTHTNQNTIILNYVFVYKGNVYVGWGELNSSDIQTWVYDPSKNSFSKVASLSIPSVQDILAVKHLFTINDIAYFIERGSSSVSQTQATMKVPGKKLYMLNLKNNTFRSVDHTYPETFYAIGSFEINNRGFAGLSSSVNGALFDYSQKFYEFQPN